MSDNTPPDHYLNSPFNACQHRYDCRALYRETEAKDKRIAELETDVAYWKKLTHDEYWQQVKGLEAENERLREALEFYADEDTYFAIMFVPDNPAGDFLTDFSVDEGSNYDYEKPGKRARTALSGSKG